MLLSQICITSGRQGGAEPAALEYMNTAVRLGKYVGSIC